MPGPRLARKRPDERADMESAPTAWGSMLVIAPEAPGLPEANGSQMCGSCNAARQAKTLRLTKTEIGSIVDLMLADLRKRLEDKQLKLVVTDAAKNAIIDGGYDPIYGARPLKRYIQSHVETMIAKEIIGGAHTAGDTLTVDADENGQLVLR